MSTVTTALLQSNPAEQATQQPSNPPAPAVEFTIEEFNKTIERITRGQARIARDIGGAILMALYFANAKKDAGAANALAKCLRKSTKKAGIMALMEEQGNLALVKQGKKEPEFQYFNAKKVWTPDAVKELRAICADWESYKPAAEASILDLLASLESLVKKAKSAEKNHKEVKHASLLERINALVAEVHAAELGTEE